jgi:CrcB protein
VLAGGLIGSAARCGVSKYLPADPRGVPVATLVVNLTGSFLLGFYLARREQTVTARWSLQFWGIGVFGSFTTFSAFSVDVLRLIDHGEATTAGIYVAASIVGGVILALVGQRIGSSIR